MAKRAMYFFATGNDLIQSLKPFELTRKIKYVKCDKYKTKDCLMHDTIDALPNLGVDYTGEHDKNPYLVMDYDTEVVLRMPKQGSKEIWYSVDQLGNPASIVFRPGGMYGTDYLIHGSITTRDDTAAKQLYNYFTKALKSGAEKPGKRHLFYMLPEALELSRRVRLITIHINQDPIYDLKLEPKC